MIKYFTLFFIGFVMLAGCNIINPVEPTPTYIHIDSFRFNNTNPGGYGSSSNNINTVFVTYNGVEIGVYSLPCTFPVITGGANQLIVSPGIAINGFNDQEGAYPYYRSVIDTLTPQAGKIINYAPVTGYSSNTLVPMPFLDAFEPSSGTQFGADPRNSIGMTVTNAPDSVFEGKGSGAIRFITCDSAECSTNTSIVLPANVAVFCEFNYKSNIPIAIGLVPVSSSLTTLPQYNNIAFAPTSKWTKVYLSLTEIISVFPATSYVLVIKAAVPVGQPNGYALLDNIKVVTSN